MLALHIVKQSNFYPTKNTNQSIEGCLNSSFILHKFLYMHS